MLFIPQKATGEHSSKFLNKSELSLLNTLLQESLRVGNLFIKTSKQSTRVLLTQRNTFPWITPDSFRYSKNQVASVIEKLIALKVITSSGLVLGRFCSGSNHCCGFLTATFLSWPENTFLTRTAQSLALTIFLVQPLES